MEGGRGDTLIIVYVFASPRFEALSVDVFGTLGNTKR